ncbi:MAG: DUF4105 domain-containing protein [Patescibacteria group bacterium]|nr:DUF4105 domain-containing protein [Patescibacteria group bacterium]
MKKKIIIIIVGVIVVVLMLFFATMTQKPSHDRTWELGHGKLPHIQISDNDIVVKDMRDFTWNDDGGADDKYITERFELDKMNRLDVIVSHFSDSDALAHIFMSFGFENGQHIVVSVETRREAHEKFSTIQGLLNKFELIYVVGTERDVIGMRTNVRGEKVYLHNVDVDAQAIQKLFALITADINAIYNQPVFYNTLSHNCTNAITRRAEEVADINFPFSYKMLLPGFVDEVLYDMDIIVKKGTFEETEAKAEIDNEKVNRDDANFSQQIRQNLKM